MNTNLPTDADLLALAFRCALNTGSALVCIGSDGIARPADAGSYRDLIRTHGGSAYESSEILSGPLPTDALVALASLLSWSVPCAMRSSATLCAEDARAAFARGETEAARSWSARSLSYTVGRFSRLYTLAVGE